LSILIHMQDAYLQTTITTYNKTAPEYIAKAQRYAPVPEREKFISFVKSGGNILDAGCGSGRDANYFASKGFTVTGIDLSDTLLSYANEHAEANVTFHNMDLRAIKLNTSFDGIWACASLLHLKRKEILPVLQKFERLITPEGILFLLLKEGEGEKMAISSTIQGDQRFFTYYSVSELRSLLVNAGFVVTDMYTWDQHERNSERPPETWISVFAKKS